MSKTRDLQNALEYYRRETGIDDVNMTEFAIFAHQKLGVPLPAVKTPLEVLTQQCSRAARAAHRTDKVTGRTYRANHMYINENGVHLWMDIDGEAPRPKMDMSATLRRNQIADDATHLDLDLEHWNRIHPDDQPIQKSFDFTEDVLERKAARDMDREDAAE